MDNIFLPWYKRIPELFEREKKYMRSFGFELDTNALKEEHIVFEGRSKENPSLSLTIKYPDGFPSFPPIVICKKVGDKYLLSRHHDPSTGQICCFGFSNERWSADKTGIDVIIEADSIIKKYPPGSIPPTNDTVPEPHVVHYDYISEQAIIIPPPFGEMQCEEFKKICNAKIKFQRYNHYGMLTSVKIDEKILSAHSSYDWFYGQFRNVKIISLDQAPPLTNNPVKIKTWIMQLNIQFTKAMKEELFIFLFPDEFGKRGRYRTAWIALRVNLNKTEWIKCYPVSREDLMIRIPYGIYLENRHAMIIGCGSLGSSVAVNLSKEGLREISLVDHDYYEPGNAIRHQVGQKWFGRLKVIATHNRIMELIPIIKVNPMPIKIGGFYNKVNRDLFFKNFLNADIIIDTTGNHSVTRYLNHLCVQAKKPLIVSSVTNGAWSAEIIRYRPGESGCWGCWNHTYGNIFPPGAPRSDLEFAPGCSQPTFIGASSDVEISAGLTSKMVVDTLLKGQAEFYQRIEEDYMVWSTRNKMGNMDYNIKVLPLTKNKKCKQCNNV